MSKPNIIFILLDDYGWMDTACYGSSFYETPNLDRLAASGMRFTDAYAACPVCSPTRASILSGKYPANVGVTDWINWTHEYHPVKGRLIDAPYIDHLPATETSIASALRDGGYATWHVGKWHLGLEPYYPDKHGFDRNIGGCEWGLPCKGYFSPWHLPTMDDPPEDGTYLTDYITDRAIDLIRHRDPQKPFFMNFCHYAVHTPIQAKPDDIKRFEAKAKRLKLDQVDPLVEGELHPLENKKHLHVMRRIIQSNPAYAAMVWNMDWNIGRLMDALDEAGIADETAIFFTSDNGGLATSEGSPTCNFPLAEGKGWMYEGGVREPLIVRWPGHVAPGTTCQVPVTSPDFYPTLLEMAGLDLMPEQHEDGVSILSLLDGGTSLDRDAIYWHYPHYGNQGGTPGSSIRQGRWKLIEFFEDSTLELYDLENDLSEAFNLVEQHPDIVSELHRKLKDWQVRVSARMPIPNPDYVPWRDADSP